MLLGLNSASALRHMQKVGLPTSHGTMILQIALTVAFEDEGIALRDGGAEEAQYESGVVQGLRVALACLGQDEPPTEKQRSLLAFKGASVPPTKDEAARKIRRLMEEGWCSASSSPTAHWRPACA